MGFQRLDVFFSWTYGRVLDSDLFVGWVTWARITKKPFSHELAAAERRILRLDELHILQDLSLHITIPYDTIVWNQKSHRFPQKNWVRMVIPGSWNMRCEIMYTLYINNKVLKMTMRLKCVPGVFSFVSGDDSDQRGSFVSRTATVIGKHICSNILPVPQEVLYDKIRVTSILFQALTGENLSKYVFVWPKSIKPLFEWKYLAIHHYPSIYFNYPPLKLTVHTWN